VRKEEERPAAIQVRKFAEPLDVEAALTEDNGRVRSRLSGSGRASAVLAGDAENSRQILFRSNFGLVRFERRDGVLHAVHEMLQRRTQAEESAPNRSSRIVRVAFSPACCARAVRPEDTLVVTPPEPA